MSVVIGGIAISLLLALAVKLLKTDQEESIRSETQSEMQMALDYISQEVREAAYVYDGDCLQGRADDPSTPATNEYCPGLKNYIIIPPNSIPVLAFWKLQSLPRECQDVVNQTNGLCRPFLMSGRTYSLIVYLLRKNQRNEIWQGKARIERYSLDQFTVTNGTLIRTTGYINPSDSRTSFRTWPMSIDANGRLLNLQLQLPSSNYTRADTLVDFVDDSRDDEPCDSDKLDSDPNKNPRYKGYKVSPSSTTLAGVGLSGVRSFYACVRVTDTATQQNQQTGQNQDVIVFLKGNTYGKQGNQNIKFLPALQTQVLGRGVVDKQPAQ